MVRTGPAFLSGSVLGLSGPVLTNVRTGPDKWSGPVLSNASGPVLTFVRTGPDKWSGPVLLFVGIDPDQWSLPVLSKKSVRTGPGFVRIDPD
jgi:hypothetical protein